MRELLGIGSAGRGDQAEALWLGGGVIFISHWLAGARLRLREHGLRVRPHGADLDAAIGGDLGERLAGHDADRDIRLGPGEPERLRRRDRNSGLLGRWTKQSDAAINPARMWV